MHIAMLAPPWIPIPAPAYGGIEEVIHLLCDGLVENGVNGFVVDDEDGMARAIGWLDEIDRARCRADGHERFGVEASIDGYEEVYRRAAGGPPRGGWRFRRAGEAPPAAGLPPRAPRQA